MGVKGAMGSGEPLRYALLGPVRAWRGAEQLDLGAPRHRAVLAVLLLHANRPVGRERLIQAVWGEPAPAYAVNQLQKYVSALRRVLEPGRGARSTPGILNWTDGGYVLKVEPDGLDLAMFQRRIGMGRGAQALGNAEQAAAELSEALNLSDGPALADVSSAFLDAERDRLAELRTAVLEERIKADLELGRHRKLVPELSRLVAEFPFRESLAALLMLALYRSGRQSDALSTFHEVRRSLLEELGVDPGREVQQMHEKILASASSLTWQAAPQDQTRRSNGQEPESTGGYEVQGLRLLPVHRREFMDPRKALAELWGSVGESGTDAGNPEIRVAVVGGMAGVKTGLPVQIVQRVIARNRFAHIQLSADLAGCSPDSVSFSVSVIRVREHPEPAARRPSAETTTSPDTGERPRTSP